MSTDREAHLAAFAAHVRRDTPPPGPARSHSAADLLARPTLAAESWPERLRRWFDDPRVVTSTLVAVAIVAGVFFYRSSLGATSASTAHASTASTAAGATTTTGGELVVHVSGAVVAPGVYRMPSGARITDAVAMAGGPLETAEPHRLNLAAPLGDGQRIHVPAAGEALPPDAAGAGSGDAANDTGPVNVNTATKDQLEALPGVGPVLADAILSERQKRGGFRSVDDLLSVRGIGEQRLADLRPLVTV